MALAFDTGTKATGNPVTSITWSHTITGSDPCLWVGDREDSSGAVTGVTYAGASLTQVDIVTAVFGTTDGRIWVKNAPATGANNVVVSQTPSAQLVGTAASYTGAAQTGQPGVTANNKSASTTSLTVTGTTVSDNSWLVGYEINDTADPTAGAGTTLRAGTLQSGTEIGDSNSALTPTGSYSLVFDISPAAKIGAVMGEMKVAAAATRSHLMGLMGLGM